MSEKVNDLAEQAREWEFVARLGDWPNPECMLWQSPETSNWLRYDYDTDAYTMMSLYITQHVHLPIPPKAANHAS